MHNKILTTTFSLPVPNHSLRAVALLYKAYQIDYGVVYLSIETKQDIKCVYYISQESGASFVEGKDAREFRKSMENKPKESVDIYSCDNFICQIVPFKGPSKKYRITCISIINKLECFLHIQKFG